MSDRSLGDKAALVTGSGSGLGEATARALAAAGAAVACLDINEAGARRTARAIEVAGGRAFALACNVADADAVFAAVGEAVERLGRLDIVVNCAAVDYVVAVDAMSVEQFDRVLAVNLRGPFVVAKAALPAMQRQGGGHVVNIASTAAVRAWGNAAAYHASKWGLVGFGRGLGVEGREHNVRVTTVIPGGMRTHWFDSFPEQGIPMPDPEKLQDPANVARAIVFAVQLPPDSVMQELIITPLGETSWP
jgi:NAD(P)-dependent dehydrogenase (short-subunit alcohol dehydrogenase family)